MCRSLLYAALAAAVVGSAVAQGTDAGASASEPAAVAPAVAASHPAQAATDAAPHAGVLLQFTLAMRRASVTSNLTFSRLSPDGLHVLAPVAHTAAWLNSTTLRLTTAQWLVFGGRYRIAIGPGARSTEGGRLPAYTLDFRVTASALASAAPADGTVNASRWGPVTVAFRWSVKQGSAESKLGLYDGANLLPGHFEWTTPRRIVRLVPDHPLEAGRQYVVRLTRGLALASGDSVRWSESSSFTTDSRPVVSESWPSGSYVCPTEGIYVSFDQPMVRSSVETHFAVAPAVAGLFGWDAESRTMLFVPRIAMAAHTLYRVTVGADVKAQAGPTMGRPFEWTFTTSSGGLTPTAVTASAGACGRSCQIAVSLGAAAQVELRVLNAAGRTVAVLPAKSLPAGLSTVVWECRSAAGTKLPAGSYLLHVTARERSGQSARALAPLVLRR